MLELMAPVFDRLCAVPLLDRCQRGDSQNSNEALHHLLWKRAPKHMFASPEIIELAAALAVLQRNCGSGGLQKILSRIGLDPTVSASLFEKMDARKEATIVSSQLSTTKTRRKVLRGLKKRKADQLKEKEAPSYESGAFDADPDAPGMYVYFAMYVCMLCMCVYMSGPSRGRGRGRGRGCRRKRASTSDATLTSSDSDPDVGPSSSRGRGKRKAAMPSSSRGRGKRKAAMPASASASNKQLDVCCSSSSPSS